MHNIHPSICGVVPPPTLEGPVANAERSSQRHHVASIARLRPPSDGNVPTPRRYRACDKPYAAARRTLVAFTFIGFIPATCRGSAATVPLGNRVGPTTKTREHS